MRKRLITPSPQDAAAHDEGWLDLDRLAVVEVTSEDMDYPVESALASEKIQGWRAADSRHSNDPADLRSPAKTHTHRAHLRGNRDGAHTQEFVLRWSGDGGRSFREIVRQQWNFSPPKQSARSRNIGLTSRMSRF